MKDIRIKKSEKYKPLKIYWLGKRLKDIYPYATKWEMFKFAVRKFIRKVVICLAVLISLFIIIQIARHSFPEQIIVVEEKEVVIDNLDQKVKEIKKEVIDNLRKCESAGYTESDGILIYDSNKVVSIGTFQFQKNTVIHYYETLYSQKITGKDAVLIALDDKKSAKLAEDIIFGTDGGYKNWLNCATKYNIKQSVDIVNKLTK